MCNEQKKIIEELNVEVPLKNETIKQFAQRMIIERTNFLKSYLESVNMKGFTLGLSGGLDSFVAGMLAKLTNYPLQLISMPHGEQSDMQDVIDSKNIINPDEFIIHNILDSTQEKFNIVVSNIQKINNDKLDLIYGNIQARERMLLQYAYAQSNDYLVIGTDHATESVIGFFTKYGDGSADIMPLAGLTKDVIYEMAKQMNAPQNIIDKAPSAGLVSSLTDEEELGIKYSNIIDFLQGKDIDLETSKKIILKFNQTKHKRHLPVVPYDTWWKRKSLIIVDCQNDFINGSLGCLENIKEIENVVKFINQNYKEINVLYSLDWHPESHSSFVQNGGLWPNHCIQGTNGAELHKLLIETNEIANPLCFYKGENPLLEEYSAYGAKFKSVTGENKYLYEYLEKDVIICGIAAEFCVKETIIDLYKNGYNVTLLKDCLGFVYKDKIQETLNELSKYCKII